MLKRIALYMKHRKHDKIRAEKLTLWKFFGYRDKDFDYKKHKQGNLWFYIKNKDIKG